MTPAVEPDAEFEALLQQIASTRGIDFTGYKRATLSRRFAKHMADHGIADYAELGDRLEASPDEFELLFDTVMINVSAFFRDPDVWRHLADVVIPRIIAAKEPDEPIRAWCAGCSGGEEPYTLAMLLAEALGQEQFERRVKIFATDIDMDALSSARAGAYTAKQLESVPDDLRDRYFDRRDGHHVFLRDMRRVVIFGRNDLMNDAPISRLDLLTCRNTLMYFDSEAQAAVIRRFHAALADGGCLVLGKSEVLRDLASAFSPADLGLRVFTKLPGARMPPVSLGGNHTTAAARTVVEGAFEESSFAQMVVGADGRVAMINKRMRTLFELEAEDGGSELKDLEVSYRPFELRSMIEQVMANAQPLRSGPAAFRTRDGERLRLEVEVRPLEGAAAGAQENVMVAFTDVTHLSAMSEQLEQSRRDLESAYEELQSTVEELETTNEELQSTNEEFETTNEGLQSANNELGRINEDLQTANSELGVANEALRARGEELARANGLMEAMLGTLRLAMAVLDRELSVLMWNAQATDMWGLKLDEVLGRHFMNLDIGLQTDHFNGHLRAALGGEEAELDLPARDLDGNEFSCHVRCIPMRSPDGAVDGVVVLMASA